VDLHPDSATAAAALNAGEADIWEQVPPDLIPLLSKNKSVTVKNNDPLGSMGMIRFNFLHPPFNNEKMRQALLYAVNQQDYVIGIAGDPKNGKPCFSYFTCGTPLATEAAADPLKGKRDIEKAKQLVKESGYKGEKVVIIDATDQPIVHSQSLLTLEILKKMGVNAEIQAGDWGTLITRRAVKEPIDKGGWNIFHTWLVGPDMVNPGGQLPDSRHRRKGVVRLADRREDGGAARSLVQRQGSGRIEEGGRSVQRRAFEFVPIIPTGQFILPTAYRANISGLIIAPINLLWNVEKK
jgi:peptide/nickel transport system substrate-binding protein